MGENTEKLIGVLHSIDAHLGRLVDMTASIGASIDEVTIALNKFSWLGRAAEDLIEAIEKRG